MTLFDKITAIMVASCCTLVLTSRAGDLIPSWENVAEELPFENITVEKSFSSWWTNSLSLRRWVTNRDISVLVELATAHRPELILASSAAYLALREIEPNKSQEVGLTLFLRDGPTNYLNIFILRQLINDHTNEPFRHYFRQALTSATCLGPVNPEAAQLLVSRLAPQVTRDWFEDASRKRSVVSFEAIVLDHMFSDMERRGIAPTLQMRELLNRYALVPGMPRYVFVEWAEESNSLYKAALRLTLEDRSISEGAILVLAVHRAKSIFTGLDLSKLQLSDYRRDILTNAASDALEENSTKSQKDR